MSKYITYLLFAAIQIHIFILDPLLSHITTHIIIHHFITFILLLITEPDVQQSLLHKIIINTLLVHYMHYQLNDNCMNVNQNNN